METTKHHCWWHVETPNSVEVIMSSPKSDVIYILSSKKWFGFDLDEHPP